MNPLLLSKLIDLKRQESTPSSTGFSVKKVVTVTALTGLGAFVLFKLGKGAVTKSISDKSSQKSFQSGNAETNAREIHIYLFNKGKSGIDMVKLRSVFRNIKSQQVFSDSSEQYKKIYEGRVLQNDLENMLEPSQAQELLAIIYGKPAKEGAKAPALAQWLGWSRRLKAGFDKTYSYFKFPDVDRECILAVFTDIPTQKEFVNVGATYNKFYGRNLITDLKNKLGPNDYKKYMRIVGSKPKQ